MALFAVEKPLGLTSHDVVDLARKQLATRRVGHTGTLDPLASGVLILASHASTKLVPYLSAEDKEYLAWISFGATTPTLDAEGPVEQEGSTEVSVQALEAVLPRFLQVTEQFPPAYSAIKVGGVKAYEAARKGEALELAARPVQYREVQLLALDSRPTPHRIGPSLSGWQLDPRGRLVELPRSLGNYPTAVIRLVVGSGTYIRAFARDLGQMLGTVAFLSGLVRTRVGLVGLERAVSPQQLNPQQALDESLVLSFPMVQLSAPEVRKVLEGVPLPIPATGLVSLVDHRRHLVAIGEGDGFKLKIRRVLGRE
jgi:tRNA pseudouridine55 synthase